MKTYLFLFSLVFGLAATQAQSTQSQFYQAYLNNDLVAWDAGIAELSRAFEQSNDPAILLQMAKGAYGAIGSCFAVKDMDAAAEWASTAEEYCLLFLDNQPKHAEAKALLAGVYGMQIGLKPMRGMSLGPKSGRLLSEAIAADENCALAYYQLGMSAYNTPEQWGGSKEKAATYLAQARQLYEQKNTTESWEYLNTLAWQGKSLFDLEQYSAAKAAYEQALLTEPTFGWVKMSLLPAVEEKLAGR